MKYSDKQTIQNPIIETQPSCLDRIRSIPFRILAHTFPLVATYAGHRFRAEAQSARHGVAARDRDGETVSEFLAASELTVDKAGLPAVLMRISGGRSALLFGPGEEKWLWLVRRDRNYYLQLASYPKPLKTLQPRFRSAAVEAGVTVRETKNKTLECKLGLDAQAAAEKAWTVFTNTMDLDDTATTTMKWL